MKKTNNKYRGGNNTIYSLNYKFDSNSIAGKISGTALDLIKRYNDLAKDAQSNNDYINAEIFRQYAEHYRKIVTEINERKNQIKISQQVEDNDNSSNAAEETEIKENPQVSITDEQVKEEATQLLETDSSKEIPEQSQKKPRKSFKIIDIHQAKNETTVSCVNDPENGVVAEPKPKRVYRRRKTAEV